MCNINPNVSEYAKANPPGDVFGGFAGMYTSPPPTESLEEQNQAQEEIPIPVNTCVLYQTLNPRRFHFGTWGRTPERFANWWLVPAKMWKRMFDREKEGESSLLNYICQLEGQLAVLRKKHPIIQCGWEDCDREAAMHLCDKHWAAETRLADKAHRLESEVSILVTKTEVLKNSLADCHTALAEIMGMGYPHPGETDVVEVIRRRFRALTSLVSRLQEEKADLKAERVALKEFLNTTYLLSTPEEEDQEEKDG